MSGGDLFNEARDVMGEAQPAQKQVVASPSSSVDTVKPPVAMRPATGDHNFMADKASNQAQDDKASRGYTAADIEVLEGLEPVRKRPGMYIGGTDERAAHHLFAEIIDNAMDEAVAGHASWIEVRVETGGFISVSDNGRGMPIDPHPKFPDKSALEVILCTLHSGGKFNSKAYEASGGLHGVGVSVCNALSEHLEVEVAREQTLYRQTFSRGIPTSGTDILGRVHNRRGTKVRFMPDASIFGAAARLRPLRLLRMSRAKAYLHSGVKIRWFCDPSLITENEQDQIPSEAVFHFPNGLRDFLQSKLGKTELAGGDMFSGKIGENGKHGSVEWALAWVDRGDGSMASYCNTVPTPDGGAHETGLRSALTKAFRGFGELVSHKKAAIITADDVMTSCHAMLSVFIREPEFQGQTKDRLASVEATRIVENIIRDQCDQWLAKNPSQGQTLLDIAIENAEDRLRRRKEREVSRKSATRKLRLPGKLADCTTQDRGQSELFVVEGDSAGGSAKQARNRVNQAVLPLRGKILNVANATATKKDANQLIADLIQALGCGTGRNYDENELRYDKVIIMTDADVDGAHISALLITFFLKEMPKLIENKHLYLACPPLYRLSHGKLVEYARDDEHKDQLMSTLFKGKSNVEIGRFKGLGEMMAAQLKETTMDPSKRTLLRITLDHEDRATAEDSVERLMGSNPEQRFWFIQERAAFARDLDI